jgi:hypothetical protein
MITAIYLDLNTVTGKNSIDDDDLAESKIGVKSLV